MDVRFKGDRGHFIYQTRQNQRILNLGLNLMLSKRAIETILLLLRLSLH